MPQSIPVRERDQLYRWMVSQLFYDGHQNLAVSLANLVQAHPACPPSDRLYHIVQKGLKIEEQEKETQTNYFSSEENSMGAGLDLEYESDVHVTAPEPALYETCYVTSHKAPCRAGAFSADGQLISTGSADASIKILDVERMLVKSAKSTADLMGAGPEIQQSTAMEMHPVIRTLYDHIEEVTCLEFHPTEQILVSGSKDYTVKFFDYSKSSVKRASRTIHEAEHIRCLSLHPTGDYVVVGTEHPTLRLYDVNTGQCFVSSVPKDQHKGAITAVKYNRNSNMYVSSSKDGDIKVWDGVSNKCINTFPKAHSGEEINSVSFSKNSKYILSSANDSLIKLWELSTNRCLIAYTGAGATGKQTHRTQAVFNHTEDYVLYPDEKTISLCSWDSRNAARQKLLSLEGFGDKIIHKKSPVEAGTRSSPFQFGAN
ncbi:Cleavage stimulation factor subunit 1 [Nymphon striatum]|nr:Cleavage stimulation factor subunit 1 [Nymphon striatum]